MSLQLGLLFSVLLASAGVGEERLIDFRVEDQFRREHTHAEFKDQAVLLVWADRKSHERVHEWKQLLRQTFAARVDSGELNMRGVGHVKGAPFFVKGRIRKKFDREPKYWALLDWDGVFREAYDPPAGQVTFLLFDRQHRLSWRSSVSEMDSAVVDSLVGQVERLVAEPRGR